MPRWFEESGQWLENVDRTHLVLASGMPVIQKPRGAEIVKQKRYFYFQPCPYIPRPYFNYQAVAIRFSPMACPSYFFRSGMICSVAAVRANSWPLIGKNFEPGTKLFLAVVGNFHDSYFFDVFRPCCVSIAAQLEAAFIKTCCFRNCCRKLTKEI